MSWIILTIISAIAGSLTRILQKILLKNEQSDPVAFAFIFQLIVAAIFLAYTLITKTLEFPNLTGLSLNIAIMVLFYSLGNIATFKAFKLADASEVSILFVSGVAWSVVSAIIFLEESITSANILGILLIIGGVAVVNYTKTKWKLNRGHSYALVAAMLFGLAFTNDVFIINRYNSVASYMIPAFALPGIITLLFNPKSAKSLPHFKSINVFGKLFLCAALYAISAIAIFTAYKVGGQASIISPISRTSVILTVILGYTLLKEKGRLIQKVIGTVLVFSGALLLAG